MIRLIFYFIAAAGFAGLWTFVLTAIIGTTLEWAFPAIREQSRWRRESSLDAIYWFAMPLINFLAVIAASKLLFSPGHWRISFTWLPGWAQLVAILLLADLAQYWWHRLLHREPLWRIHAVHHSMTETDWLSNNRRHPLEIWLWASIFTGLNVLGFSPAAIAGYATVVSLFGSLPHANLSWTYGPLRYIFVSPVYHRWHHSSPAEGGLKNYASMFSCIDLAFGTFYMPRGIAPREIRFHPVDMPGDFVGQLAFPFTSRRKSEAGR